MIDAQDAFTKWTYELLSSSQLCGLFVDNTSDKNGTDTLLAARNHCTQHHPPSLTACVCGDSAVS